MTEKLIGNDYANDIDGGVLAKYIILQKFACSAAGTLSEISSGGAGAVGFKVGIYSDVSGVPTDLLAYKNGSNTSSSTAYVTCTLNTTVALALGTYYWLAIIANLASGCAYFSTSGGTTRYKNLYSFSDMPSTCPTGLSSANWNMLLRGNGLLDAGFLPAISGYPQILAH